MNTSSSIAIAPPTTPTDFEAIKTLIIEYAESLGVTLAHEGLEAELADLPGKYASPGGALLLARGDDGTPAGAVALLKISPEIGEMKRLYVRPAFRGKRTTDGVSIGRALAEGIVDKARSQGYRRVRLDTIAGKMGVAMSLYRSMGFVVIPPYYSSPVPDTAYMELAL
ncbi:MAG: GNAT family N-acetyltransferase [Reyranellaceae bacterium]